MKAMAQGIKPNFTVTQPQKPHAKFLCANAPAFKICVSTALNENNLFLLFIYFRLLNVQPKGYDD